MKLRIEIDDLEAEEYVDNGTILISDPLDPTELTEILPILLKPSMFGNTNVYRVSILPEGA